MVELIIYTIGTQKAGHIRCHRQNIGILTSDPESPWKTGIILFRNPHFQWKPGSSGQFHRNPSYLMWIWRVSARQEALDTGRQIKSFTYMGVPSLILPLSGTALIPAVLTSIHPAVWLLANGSKCHIYQLIHITVSQHRHDLMRLSLQNWLICLLACDSSHLSWLQSILCFTIELFCVSVAILTLSYSTFPWLNNTFIILCITY